MPTSDRFMRHAARVLVVVWMAAAAHAGEQPRKKENPVPVTVVGDIVDADTQLPIQRFMIQAGKFDPKDPEQVTWGFSLQRTQSQTGRFQTTVRWHQGWTARILCDGYLPQPVLNHAPPAGQNKVEVKLQLKRGRYVSGRVLDHAGQPLAGASVFAVGPTGVNLAAGKAVNSFDGSEDKNAKYVLTDKNGRFEIPVGGATKLAVSSPDFHAWPAGLPDADDADFVIRLPEPGKVVVWYDIEGGPGQQDIFWQLLGHKMSGFEGVRVEQKAQVANEDKLVLSGLTPGEYQFARYRMLRTSQMGFGRMIERTFVTVEPGRIHVLRFARPTGVRVAGTVLDQQKAKLDTVLVYILTDPPDEPPKPGLLGSQKILDAQVTDAQGHFQTERLPPGTYAIYAEGYPPLTPEQQRFTGIVLPRFTGQAKITVPEKGKVPKVELKLKDRQTGEFVK